MAGVIPARQAVTAKTHRKKAMVSASELCQMGLCERLVLFDNIYGKRTSQHQQEAIERGRTEHERFFREGVQRQPDVETSLAKPWCFCASLAWGSDAGETVLLRKFRDRLLRRSSAGRWLIALYYRTAPGLCRHLEGHPRVIRMLRWGLAPALWIARAALAIQGRTGPR